MQMKVLGRISVRVMGAGMHGCQVSGGGVLDFGLDGGVPPGPQDPNPCLEVKKGTHV